MPKTMLINATRAEEVRGAIVDDRGRLAGAKVRPKFGSNVRHIRRPMRQHPIEPRHERLAVDLIAKLICASLEGMTVFIGQDKMWTADHEGIKRIAIDNFVDLITNS